MLPPDIFEAAVSVLSQHQLFISAMADALQQEPDYLQFHFNTAWMWIASILIRKRIYPPISIPKKGEVEMLVKEAINRSRNGAKL